jgi:hypothetical protein
MVIPLQVVPFPVVVPQKTLIALMTADALVVQVQDAVAAVEEAEIKTSVQQRVLRNRGDRNKTQLYIAFQIQLGRDVY